MLHENKTSFNSFTIQKHVIKYFNFITYLFFFLVYESFHMCVFGMRICLDNSTIPVQ